MWAKSACAKWAAYPDPPLVMVTFSGLCVCVDYIKQRNTMRNVGICRIDSKPF